MLLVHGGACQEEELVVSCSLVGADRPPKQAILVASCQTGIFGLVVCPLVALSIATVRSDVLMFFGRSGPPA